MPIILWVYFIWVLIFPNEAFYKEYFKEVTQLVFPENATFLYKSASIPDQHGDYTSVFVFKTNYGEVEKIKSQLINLKFEEITIDSVYSEKTRIAIEKAKLKLIKQYKFESENSEDFYVGIFEDKNNLN